MWIYSLPYRNNIVVVHNESELWTLGERYFRSGCTTKAKRSSMSEWARKGGKRMRVAAARSLVYRQLLIPLDRTGTINCMNINHLDLVYKKSFSINIFLLGILFLFRNGEANPFGKLFIIVFMVIRRKMEKEARIMKRLMLSRPLQSKLNVIKALESEREAEWNKQSFRKRGRVKTRSLILI